MTTTALMIDKAALKMNTQRIKNLRSELDIRRNFLLSCKDDLRFANRMNCNDRKAIAMRYINISRNLLKLTARELHSALQSYAADKALYLSDLERQPVDYSKLPLIDVEYIKAHFLQSA